MLDILPTLEAWLKDGKSFAFATVVKTWGSAPRPIGSSLAISSAMEMAGSVSGGCVEGQVVQKAVDILSSGKPELLKFGVSDEEAWSVGLSCGGSIQVWVEPFIGHSKSGSDKEVWKKLHFCLKEDNGCILLTEMAGHDHRHALVMPGGEIVGTEISEGMVETALTGYKERRNFEVELDGKPWFVQVFPPKSRMLIVGAAHITADLVQLGNLFQFETIVIDPRGIFAHKTTFADPPGQLYAEWPAEVIPRFTLDAFTYAVLLTHDPKIDDQALHLLLRSEAGYIGALGSRRTHAKRVARLEEAGFSPEEIKRIHAPVGVNINAKKPGEIALSIMAEIIQVKNAFQ